MFYQFIFAGAELAKQDFLGKQTPRLRAHSLDRQERESTASEVRVFETNVVWLFIICLKIGKV